MQLAVERHEKYNRTREPCGHSFRGCIDNFMAKSVGCILLENKQKTNLSKCNSINEIRKFEELYKLFTTRTNKGFRTLTGCLPPCTYMKYNVLLSQKVSTEFGFNLQFVARELTIVKEVRKKKSLTNSGTTLPLFFVPR